MKLPRNTGVALLIALPIILGLLLLVREDTGHNATFSSVGTKKLGIVKVEGVIGESESTVKQLKQLRQDNSVAGILLHINSPGGATAPSQEIYHAVLQFRQSNKPVVVSMGNVAASGGYYIASPATRIFANAGTITGSIGVIMNVPLYTEIAKKIGIEMRTYKSGSFKDIASPYRSMDSSEHKMIQAMLDDTHDQFIRDVAAARSITIDSLIPIADGRIFTGNQARARNLIDTIGGQEDALAYLRSITGVGQNCRIIDKRDGTGLIHEWVINEMVHLFPQLHSILRPLGMHCLTTID